MSFESLLDEYTLQDCKCTYKQDCKYTYNQDLEYVRQYLYDGAYCTVTSNDDSTQECSDK